MAQSAKKEAATPRKRKVKEKVAAAVIGAAAVMEDARRAGLLKGEKTEHLSFRAPRALIEAAQRQSGIVSPTELGILALAMLAQPDPIAAFLKRTRGRLGETHTLEY